MAVYHDLAAERHAISPGENYKTKERIKGVVLRLDCMGCEADRPDRDGNEQPR
jgi:hypothetical protein